MIKLMTKREEELAEQDGHDPFRCRILCIQNMYGKYSFADCWVQQNDNQESTAYLSKLDGVLTLFATSSADFDELSTFIEVVGATFVQCHVEHAAKLNMVPTETGAILKWKQQFTEKQAVIVNPGLQQVYQVLKSCESETFQIPEFEPFYLDMSHKVRHYGAKVLGVVNEQEQLIATAMTVAETESTAIIGAVAVKPNYQKNGLGKLAVNGLIHLCTQNKQEHIYVCCNKKENQIFYQSLGFAECGTWAEIKRI